MTEVRLRDCPVYGAVLSEFLHSQFFWLICKLRLMVIVAGVIIMLLKVRS